MTFLPVDFYVPALVAGPRFRIRPITVHDVVKDYAAIMTSQESLWAQFGEVWGWPSAGLTFDQALIDLAWLQKETQLRRAFSFAVLTTDEERLLGRVHVIPPRGTDADAAVVYWIRTDEPDNGLEEELRGFVTEWVTTTWPFKTVAYPGREVSWTEWWGLPPRTEHDWPPPQPNGA